MNERNIEEDNAKNTPVEVITWTLNQYKKEIGEQDIQTTRKITQALLKEIQKHFSNFQDNIIYFDIHEDNHHYVDEDELWMESEYTIEITMDSMTPSLLAEIERVFGEVWELQSTHDGIMRLKFDLNWGRVVKIND